MQRKHSVTDLIFTLTLFCVFALSALIVVVIGANVYKSTVSGMNENYSTRTAAAYINEKVREFDRVENGFSSIELESFPGENDLPALRLSRQSEESQLLVYIYYYDGALRELATAPEYAKGISPAAGQVVAELSCAAFEQLSANLYRFTAAGATGEEELLFTLHSYS